MLYSAKIIIIDGYGIAKEHSHTYTFTACWFLTPYFAPPHLLQLKQACSYVSASDCLQDASDQCRKKLIVQSILARYTYRKRKLLCYVLLVTKNINLAFILIQKYICFPRKNNNILYVSYDNVSRNCVKNYTGKTILLRIMITDSFQLLDICYPEKIYESFIHGQIHTCEIYLSHHSHFHISVALSASIAPGSGGRHTQCKNSKL